MLGPNVLSCKEPEGRADFGCLSSSLDHHWRLWCLLAIMVARTQSILGHLPSLQPSCAVGLPWSILPGGRRLQPQRGTIFLIYSTRADLSQGLPACWQPMGALIEKKISSKWLKLVVGWGQLLGLQPQKPPQETISSTSPIYTTSSKTG